MDRYTTLFCGDVVGKPGREILRVGLPALRKELNPTFVIVNGENSAAGVGITPDIAEEMFGLGIDVITLGNHAFNKREVYGYLDSGKPIVRPYNMPADNPGCGSTVVEKDGVKLAVMNLCGRVFMDAYDDPFRAIDRLLDDIDTPHRLLDFHAEATSEKQAMGWYVDGRVSAVVGTHTHVTTADERILPGGTAFISDVGMTGPADSVLGMDRDIVLKRFKTSMPHRFEVGSGPGVICAVSIDVQRTSGRATSIRRIRFENGAMSAEE